MKRNPLIPRKERKLKTSNLNKSAGILDDYAVRKVIHTQESNNKKIKIKGNSDEALLIESLSSALSLFFKIFNSISIPS